MAARARPLAVRTWGAGPAVLFLHGLGASSRYWDRLAGLGGGYRGIAPDLAGFGRSPKPRSGRYDLDYHLEALAPHLPARAVVVGHSVGAILAAALAGRHPARVRGLLLVGLPAFPDRETARREVSALGMLARGTVEGGVGSRLVCGLMCATRPLGRLLAPRLHPELPAAVAADGVEHTWTSYSRTLASVVVEHRVAPDLLAARRPTTLLGSPEDPDAPVGHLRALAAELQAAGVPTRLRLLDGGHQLPLVAPQAVRDELADLLARLPP